MTQFAQEVKRLNVGVELAYVVLIVGILTASLFAWWIGKTHMEGAGEIKVARVATLVFAAQSLLFGLGILAYVVNELTLHFPHLEHPGLAGFAWEYPYIGGLLLASVGYSMIFRSLGSPIPDVHDEAPSEIWAAQ